MGFAFSHLIHIFVYIYCTLFFHRGNYEFFNIASYPLHGYSTTSSIPCLRKSIINFGSPILSFPEFYQNRCNSGMDRYLDPDLNLLCICFEKFNETNEPLVLAFDLDQLPSHNPAINSTQDILE
ncbi:hypothetical protein VP01_1447g2, partial [Puccinia sorghi]